jgi:uncharacterized protein (TIRG00374 family)
LSRNIKKTLKILLPLLLGVFLVWFALSKVSIDELIFYLKKADYKWIVLGVFFGFLSHLSRAYRWRFMLDPLGYKIKLENSIMAVFAAYLINFTIPRAGEIARASVLTNYENVPFEKGFGTIVSERIADVVVMMGIIALTLFLQFEFIYDFFIQRFNPLKIGVSVLLLITVVFIAFKIVKRSQSRFAKKIKGFFNGLLEGILSIFKMKKSGRLCSTRFLFGVCIF